MKSILCLFWVIGFGLLLVYVTSCTGSNGNHTNLCTNATTQPVLNDTSEAKAMRLMSAIIAKDKSSFKKFTLDNEQFVKYKSLVLKKEVYLSDSIEICFLQRVDPSEVKTKSPSQSICFNEKSDSLNTFNNYSQLLVKFPQSRFVSIESDNFIEYDVVTVAKTGKYIMIGNYIKGSSGFGANYLHIYVIERVDRHLIMHKCVDWKIQEITWLN